MDLYHEKTSVPFIKISNIFKNWDFLAWTDWGLLFLSFFELFEKIGQFFGFDNNVFYHQRSDRGVVNEGIDQVLLREIAKSGHFWVDHNENLAFAEVGSDFFYLDFVEWAIAIYQVFFCKAFYDFLTYFLLKFGFF